MVRAGDGLQLELRGENEELAAGLTFWERERGICTEEKLILLPRKWDRQALRVEKHGREAVIFYREKAHFYRGTAKLLQHITSEEWTFEENVHFSSNGVMLDCSRNAVPNMDNLKNWLTVLASLGMNCLFLYMEDTYELEGYPYFGTLRGRYTKEELRQIDQWAGLLGIEVIPCIQTLGHLRTPLKYPAMKAFWDTSDVLLVGKEETYELIETMIRTLTQCLSTRRFHIGMDEAMGMGQGTYFQKHGYRDRLELMREHMDRVMEICGRYDVEPMIWSDMYLRSVCGGEYYGAPRMEAFTDELKPPGGLAMVYWDYYHSEPQTYEEYLKIHQTLSGDVWFAGGAWTWNGLAPNYSKAAATTNAAMKACRSMKVRQVVCTLWQDNGAETPAVSGLPGVVSFAEAGFGHEIPDQELDQWLTFLCGSGLEDVMLLEEPDLVCLDRAVNWKECNPSKYLCYEDPLLGLFDGGNARAELGIYYKVLSKKLAKACERASEWRDLFEYYHGLALFLEQKADLGIRIRNAYRRGDRRQAGILAGEVIPVCIECLERLRERRRRVWERENKIFGYEVLDIRMGGIKARLESAASRLSGWCGGKYNELPELEESPLPYEPETARGGCTCPLWEHIAAPGNVTGV